MQIDWQNFSPLSAISGGAVIGLAASLCALLLGRVAGVSGILAGLAPPRRGDLVWRLAFVAGLFAAPAAFALAHPLQQPEFRAGAATLILAGVAVSALLTSAQTFLQQQASAQSIARVYVWLLGSLASASWSSVDLVLPYVLVCTAICVVAGRALDVMSVGEDESRSLGVPVRRVRFIVIAASSLGTAAIVSAVGLIGFVGIIVPHIVRLLVGTSYRRILPISVAFGAAFLVFADTIARTVIAPSELPLGVVTALVGAPVFVLILSLRRRMVR